MPILAPAPIAAGAVTLDAMRHHRRVLVVSAPAGDPRLAEQRAFLDAWQVGATDRDVSLIEIAADRVVGTSDAAADLRRRLHLPADRFAAVLVGKDGHIALYADHPLGGAALAAAIDAMPMRRAGLR